MTYRVPRRFIDRFNQLSWHYVESQLDCRLEEIVQTLLPDGHRRGREWIAHNPTRDDRHVGSFSVNLETGLWADFACGAQGRDVVALAMYLWALSSRKQAIIQICYHINL